MRSFEVRSKGRCPRRTRYRRPRRLEECVRLRADFRFRRTRTSRPAVKPRVPRDRSRAPSRHIQGRDESESRRQEKPPPGSRCSGFRISVSRHRGRWDRLRAGWASNHAAIVSQRTRLRCASDRTTSSTPIVKHHRRKGGGGNTGITGPTFRWRRANGRRRAFQFLPFLHSSLPSEGLAVEVVQP